MTISSNVTRETYLGNGTTVAFAFNNRVFRSTDLAVYLDDVLQTGGYQVQDLDTAAATVVFDTAPISAATIVILSVIPIEQTTAFKNQGRFNAEVHEDEFDRTNLRILKIQNDIEVVKDDSLQRKNGQNVMEQELVMGGFKITDVAPGTAATDAVQLQQVPLLNGDDIIIPSVKESVVLADGQTAVTFVDNTAIGSDFEVIGDNVDSGPLSESDYTITGDYTIELADSYPSGTVLLLVKNKAYGDTGQALISDKSLEFVFDDVDAYKGSPYVFPVGKVIKTLESEAGQGGGESWIVFPTSSVTPDDIDVIQSTAVPTQSIVKRFNGKITGNPNSKYRAVGVAIRNNGAGWEYIEDGGHEKIGFGGGITVEDLGSVRVIRVPYDFSGNKVGSMFCDVDETLSALSLRAGASVGTDFIDISITGDLRGSVSLVDGSVSLPSHLIGSITGIKNASGSVTLTHPSNRGTVPIVSVVSSSGRSVYNPAVNFNSTTTEIIPQLPVSGYAYWSGASAQIITLCNNVTVSESAGVFTVTHPTTSASDLPVVSSRDGTVLANWDNVNSTAFDIKFRDYSGSLQGASSSQSRVSFSCSSLVPANIPYGVIGFDLGVGYLEPDNIVSSAGNIWLFGIVNVGETD